MMKELQESSKEEGVEMNLLKIKFISNRNVQIEIK